MTGSCRVDDSRRRVTLRFCLAAGESNRWHNRCSVDVAVARCCNIRTRFLTAFRDWQLHRTDPRRTDDRESLGWCSGRCWQLVGVWRGAPVQHPTKPTAPAATGDPHRRPCASSLDRLRAADRPVHGCRRRRRRVRQVSPSSRPSSAPTAPQPVAPPAISGGTLRVLRRRHTRRWRPIRIATASTSSTCDQGACSATVALTPGDEPGRVVRRRRRPRARRAPPRRRRGQHRPRRRDASSSGARSARRPAASPTTPATDLLHVACADGAARQPAGGGRRRRAHRATRRDLRDVVVDGPRLRVSRFRSAELLDVDADGTVSGAIAHGPAVRAAACAAASCSRAGVAWKMTGCPTAA